MTLSHTSLTDLVGYSSSRTIPDLFFERVSRTPNEIAYSEFQDRAWADVTWMDVNLRVGAMRTAFDNEGLKPGERVAILLCNCVDWIAFDLAAMANGLITVPLYLFDGEENIAYILAHSGARICLTDKIDRWLSLSRACDACKELKSIWLRQPPSVPVAGDGRDIKYIEELMPDRPVPSTDIRCAAEDVATIIHTSGTTGRPKGVMLSHRALLWNADAITKFVPPLKSDVFLSVLPLAHAFERTMGFYVPLVGGARVVFSRSVETLREDIRGIKPTILVAVPKLYERFHEAILEKASRNPVTEVLTRHTAELGWRLFQARRGRGAMPGPLTRGILWPVLNRLVARKVMTAFGGRLRVAVSGGAALSETASHFLIGLGLPLVEGYGLTETAPVVTATTPETNYPGSVGRALEGVKLKLDTTGELLVWSPSVMSGYWQEPEKTSEVLDADGWLHTGDLAEFRDGQVFIKGRQKEIIALSTGKKVAPSMIEERIASASVFDQVIAVGDGRPCIAALVLLNRSSWKELAEKLYLDPDNPNHPDASKALLDVIGQLTAGIPDYARVRGVHALAAPCTIENGLLTPTLKIKRAAIAKKLHAEIDSLYADLRSRAA